MKIQYLSVTHILSMQSRMPFKRYWMRYDVLNKVTAENWEKLYVEYLMEMV